MPTVKSLKTYRFDLIFPYLSVMWELKLLKFAARAVHCQPSTNPRPFRNCIGAPRRARVHANSLTVTTITVALNGTGHPQPAADKFRWPDKGIFRGKGHGRWMIFLCEFETFIMAYYNLISGQYHPQIPANSLDFGHMSHFAHDLFWRNSCRFSLELLVGCSHLPVPDAVAAVVLQAEEGILPETTEGFLSRNILFWKLKVFFSK